MNNKNTKTLENTVKEQSWRLVTFETLITSLTIENNNLNIHSDSSIKSNMGKHSQFLRCFNLSAVQKVWKPSFVFSCLQTVQ